MISEHTSLLLSVKDIAAWQIPGLQTHEAHVRAALPALQRGAVWKADQVEALWDSVWRGFPAGAFVLAPFCTDKGAKRFLYAPEQADMPPSTHHLLDGQQRSNALALGFLDPWRPGAAPSPPAVLWLDLEPPEPTDEREVVFRVLTRSHPWGYRRSLLTSESPRLPAEKIRDAVAAYAQASPELHGKMAGEIPLRSVWPWDAHAALPFCFLLEAVEENGDLSEHIRRRLQELPFWREDLSSLHGQGWGTNVLEILHAQSGPSRDRFDRIVQGVRRLLGKRGTASYRIPALVVPELTLALSGAEPVSRGPVPEDAERQDPVETLFIRINSSGTPLAGEELVYSILKSIWPEAEQCIDAMDVRLAQPSRLVVLAARLVLAGEKAFQEKPPAAPDVSRFRRLVNGGERDARNFRKKLLDFFQRGTAAKVFSATRDLLTKNQWSPMPAVLAADMARRSPNVMFLLMRWVQRLLADKQHPGQLGKKSTLRTLGAVTALSWFARNDAHCLTAAWPRLQEASSGAMPQALSESFALCFHLTNGKPGMIPPVPPDVLQATLDANILERHGFNTPDGHFWNSWSWESLVSLPTHHKHLGDKLHRWYHRSFAKTWIPRTEEASDAGEVDLEGVYQQAWVSFVEKLRGEKRLLLFAQREWLSHWFLRYDPTAPDQLDDSDRPWDFDHIHPVAHLARRKNVPRLIRDWHGSIGNLRAWPLQANRGDGDKPPREKLTPSTALLMFDVYTAQDLLDASFVEDGHEFDSWVASTPHEDSFIPAYLGNGTTYGVHRLRLVRAILGRLLRIYRTWYDTLLIGDLMAR